MHIYIVEPDYRHKAYLDLLSNPQISIAYMPAFPERLIKQSNKWLLDSSTVGWGIDGSAFVGWATLTRRVSRSSSVSMKLWTLLEMAVMTRSTTCTIPLVACWSVLISRAQFTVTICRKELSGQSVHRFVCLYIYRLVYLPSYRSIYLSIYQFVYLCIPLPMYLSVFLSIYLFIYLSICLATRLWAVG